jgi:predicted O-methyltransferase YrrM
VPEIVTYQFRKDDVSQHVETWRALCAGFIGKPNLRCLEVGSREGLSAAWFLDNVLIDPTSSITCVDKQFSPVFHKNMERGGHCDRVRAIERDSFDALVALNAAGEVFDLIYIDADHKARACLQDGVLAFRMLRDDGLMVFDDYGWRRDLLPDWKRPDTAIDAFLACYKPHLRLLHKGFQVAFRRKATKW